MKCSLRSEDTGDNLWELMKSANSNANASPLVLIQEHHVHGEDTLLFNVDFLNKKMNMVTTFKVHLSSEE